MKQKILGLFRFPKRWYLEYSEYGWLKSNREWVKFIDWNAKMTLKAIAKRGGSEELPSQVNFYRG